MRPTTRKMSDHHERHIQETFGGYRTAGSGNQPAKPMDVRQGRHHTAVAFAVDGKSTLAKSMSISRAMLDKAVDQAHGERPMVAVRFYDDERLRGFEDWSMVRENDMLELVERSEMLSQVEAMLESGATPEAILEALR